MVPTSHASVPVGRMHHFPLCRPETSIALRQALSVGHVAIGSQAARPELG